MGILSDFSAVLDEFQSDPPPVAPVKKQGFRPGSTRQRPVTQFEELLSELPTQDKSPSQAWDYDETIPNKLAHAWDMNNIQTGALRRLYQKRAAVSAPSVLRDQDRQDLLDDWQEIASSVYGGPVPDLEKRLGTGDDWSKFDDLHNKLVDVGHERREARVNANPLSLLDDPHMTPNQKVQRLAGIMYDQPDKDWERRLYLEYRLPFAGMAIQAADTLRFNSALTKIATGDPTAEDYVLAAGMIAKQAREGEDTSILAMARDMGTRLPALAIEFGFTGGAATATRQGLRQGLAKALGVSMLRNVPRSTLSTLPRLGVKAASAAGGLAAQTALNPQLIASQMAQRMTPRYEPWQQGGVQIFLDEAELPLTAGLRGSVQAFIEIASEASGGLLTRGLGGGIGKLLGAKGAGQVSDKVLRASFLDAYLRGAPGRTVAMAQRLLAKGGINGFVGEIEEERWVESLNMLLGLEPAHGVTGDLLHGEYKNAVKQLAAEGIVFAPLGLAHGLVNEAARHQINRENLTMLRDDVKKFRTYQTELAESALAMGQDQLSQDVAHDLAKTFYSSRSTARSWVWADQYEHRNRDRETQGLSPAESFAASRGNATDLFKSDIILPMLGGQPKDGKIRRQWAQWVREELADVKQREAKGELPYKGKKGGPIDAPLAMVEGFDVTDPNDMIEVGVRTRRGTAEDVLSLSMAALRQDGVPQLNAAGEDTGWLRVDHELGATLVHPTQNVVVDIKSEDRGARARDVAIAHKRAAFLASTTPVKSITGKRKVSQPLVTQPKPAPEPQQPAAKGPDDEPKKPAPAGAAGDVAPAAAVEPQAVEPQAATEATKAPEAAPVQPAATTEAVPGAPAEPPAPAAVAPPTATEATKAPEQPAAVAPATKPTPATQPAATEPAATAEPTAKKRQTAIPGLEADVAASEAREQFERQYVTPYVAELVDQTDNQEFGQAHVETLRLIGQLAQEGRYDAIDIGNRIFPTLPETGSYFEELTQQVVIDRAIEGALTAQKQPKQVTPEPKQEKEPAKPKAEPKPVTITEMSAEDVAALFVEELGKVLGERQPQAEPTIPPPAASPKGGFAKKTGAKQPAKAKQGFKKKATDAQARADEALAELAAALKEINLSTGGPLTPRVLAAVAKVVATQVAAKAYQFADVIQSVAKVIGDRATRLIGPQLRAAWDRIRERDTSGVLSESQDVDEILGAADEQAIEPSERPPGVAPIAGEPRREDLEAEPAEAGEAVPTERPVAGPAAGGGGELAGDQGALGEPGTPAAPSEQAGDAGVGVPAGPGRGRGSRGSASGTNKRLSKTDRVGGGESFKHKARYADNIAAIKLVKQLAAEDRLATPAEQEILVKYVGWGGLKQAFGRGESVEGKTVYSPMKGWEREFTELREALTEEEWSSAKRSIQNAHFTDPKVVRAIWDGLVDIGFKGGRIVEPSMGSGLFFALMPEAIAEHPATQLRGVELDLITGAIAKQLHQAAEIHVGGFEDIEMKDDSVDLFISNVPFSNKVTLRDRVDKGIPKAIIHNFFFNKAAKKTRPGGLVVFITSRFTLDSVDSSHRKAWNDLGLDMVGAVRLPTDAFKGIADTSVVTDVVILQKREPGVIKPATDQPWIKRGELQQTGYLEFKGETKEKVRNAGTTMFPVNQYYVAHPEHIVGELSWTGTMHRVTGGREISVEREGADVPARIRTIMGQIGEAVDRARLDKIAETPAEAEDSKVDALLTDDLKEGDITITSDHRIWVIENGARVEVPAAGIQHERDKDKNIIAIKPSKAVADRYRSLLPVVSAANKLVGLQASRTATDEEVEAAREELNRVYDAAVEEYGPLSAGKNKTVLSASIPVMGRALSLERFDPATGSAEKTAIFSERTERPIVFKDRADTAEEALLISLSQMGQLDLAHIAKLRGVTVAAAIDELGASVYKNPAGDWELASLYLSGNVRQKLHEAREAAGKDEQYRRNVEALEAAQPVDKSIEQIQFGMGATWIPTSDYEQFIDELVGRGTDIRRVPENNKWLIKPLGSAKLSSRETIDYGTSDLDAVELIDKALNNSPIKVMKGRGDERYEDVAASAQARAKQQAIKDAFASWLWSDDKRAARLHRHYNDTFNDTVDASFDGSHLEFPGMSTEVREMLSPHQVNAVWRYLMNGNTGLFHVVGAGKSWTMAAMAMEAKRRSGNPSYTTLLTIPNHLVTSGQMNKEILEAYPSAKVLAATPEMLSRVGRASLLRRIATENYDIVVVAHSSFEMIPISEDFERDYIQNELDDLERQVRIARADSDKSYEAELEGMKLSLLKKLQEISARVGRDVDEVTFETLGVQALFVDEAHNYKNLPMRTRLGRVPGVKPEGALKAIDMHMKVTFMNAKTNGRGIVFATGTPIANAIGEAYNMQRYLQPNELKLRGVESFDAWATTFAEVESKAEIDPAGRSMRMHARMRKYRNLGELMRIFRKVADVQTADILAHILKPPKLKTGRPIRVESARNEWLDAFTDEIQERARLVRSGSVDPTEDNMLKIMTAARRAALDIRLIDPDYPDLADSKINKAVESVHRIWEDTSGERLTQLVWIDLVRPEGKGTDRIDLYREMVEKLVAKGIPRSEIVVKHDLNERTEGPTFDKMNRGEIRVMIGSTEKMATGVNVQRLLVASHHLVVPQRPDQLTQRQGRMLRRGNQNKEVMDFQYVAVGSFDAFMWDMLERKANFINSAMRGAVTESESDEGDRDDEMTAAEMKSAAADNPELAEFVVVESRVRQLELERRGHEGEQHELRRKLDSGRHSVAWHAKRAADFETAAKEYRAYVESVPEGEIDARLNGKAYTDKKEFGDALLAALPTKSGDSLTFKFMSANLEAAAKGKQAVLVGDKYEMEVKSWAVTMNFGDASITPTDLGMSAAGNITKLTNAIESQLLPGQKYHTDIAAKQVEQNEAMLTRLDRAWPKAEELTAKRTRRDELSAKLRSGGSEAETAEMAARLSSFLGEPVALAESGVFIMTDSGEAVPEDALQRIQSQISDDRRRTAHRRLMAAKAAAIEYDWTVPPDAPKRKGPRKKGLRKAGAEQAAAEEADRPDLRRAAGFLGGGDVRVQKTRADVLGQPSDIQPGRKTGPIDFSKVLTWEDTETDQRWRKNNAPPTNGWLKQVGASLKTLLRRATRTHQFLSTDPKWAVAKDSLRRLKDVRSIAMDKVHRRLGTILNSLGKTQLEVFEMFLATENMLHAHGVNESLRNGVKSLIALQRKNRQLRKAIKHTPALQRALDLRSEIKGEFVEELVDAKLAPKEWLKNEAYFHQQVLTYRLTENPSGPAGGKLNLPKPGSSKARSKGDLSSAQFDYNTSYVEAEFAWMIEQQIALDTKLIEQEIKGAYDRKSYYESLAEREAKKLADAGSDKPAPSWQALAKADGYDTFVISPGHRFYPATTIPQKLAAQLYQGIITEAKLTKDQLDTVLAVGAPTIMVLPKELVETLNQKQFAHPPLAGGLFKTVYGGLKSWLTAGGKRILGYITRNVLGDLGRLLAAAPGALAYVGQAIKDMRRYFYSHDLSLDPHVRNARDGSVINSGLTEQDVPSALELPLLQRFLKGPGLAKKTLRAPAALLDYGRKFARFTDSVLRYASYRYYLDKLNKGQLRHFGGSRKADVLWVQSYFGNEAAAAKLARELSGDYGALTELGTDINAGWYMFWSFEETNLKAWSRIVINSATIADFKRTGIPLGVGLGLAVTARIGSLYALVWFWNNVVAPYVFDEDDDEYENSLTKYERGTLNVNLGKNSDGSRRTFRNVDTLSSLMQWVGLTEYLGPTGEQHLAGQITTRDALWEMFKTGPLSKLVGGVNPFAKGAHELVTGESLFPDPTAPRKIDRWTVIPNMWSVQDEIAAARGLMLGDGTSTRPHYYQRLLFGVSSPKQTALSEMYDLRRKFLNSKGKPESAAHALSKYRNAKYAAYNDDYEAFSQWRANFLADFEAQAAASGEKTKTGAWRKFHDAVLNELDPIADANQMTGDLATEFETKWLNQRQRDQLFLARGYSHEIKDKLYLWWESASRDTDTPEQRQQYIKDLRKLRATKADTATSALPKKTRERARETITEINRILTLD